MKLICTLLLSGMFIATQAQFGAGALWLGGGICYTGNSSESTFDGTTTDGPKSSELDIKLGGQYFINDSWSAGGALAFSTQKTEETGDKFGFESTENLVRVKGSARYWWNCGNPEGEPRRIRPYIAGSVGIGTGKAENSSTSGGETFTSTDDITRFRVGLNAGIVYPLVPELVLGLSTGELGFLSETRKNGDFEQSESWFDFKSSLKSPRITLNWVPNGEKYRETTSR